MAGEELHVDTSALWRVYRDPVHGLCLGVTVPGVAWFEIAVRLNAEEAAAFECGNLKLLADQADRVRAWPDQFRDRLVEDERPRRQ